MNKKFSTLEMEYTHMIFEVAQLIDSSADIQKIDAARSKRNLLKTEILKIAPNFDRGYT